MKQKMRQKQNLPKAKKSFHETKTMMTPTTNNQPARTPQPQGKTGWERLQKKHHGNQKKYPKTTAQETFPEFSQIFEHQTHPKMCSGQESEAPNANNQREQHHDHVRHHEKKK